MKVPSRLELSHVLRNPAGKERRLAKALAKIRDRYDLVIIDCAPTESVLTEAAYFASRFVLVPVKPEFLASIGLPLLARSLSKFRQDNEDHQIDVAGIVFNYGAYSVGPEAKQAIKEVTKLATDNSWPIFHQHIPYSLAVPKSAREGASMYWTSYAPQKIKNAVAQFSQELFTAIGL